VGVNRVLGRQWMQLELRGKRLDLVFLGPVETDPRHAFGVISQALEGLRQRRRGGHAVSVDVDGAVDDPGPSCVSRLLSGNGETIVVLRFAPWRFRLAPSHEGANR
jgi:hypothetical protein